MRVWEALPGNLWETPRAEGALAFLPVWENQGQNAMQGSSQLGTSQESKEGRACSRVQRAGVYSTGSVWIKGIGHCWKPVGLPQDLTGHTLTFWHSLSRAAESGSRCRTKRRSRQQRGANHHWLSWERKGDTFISCRHQGKRPEKHTGAWLPAVAATV